MFICSFSALDYDYYYNNRHFQFIFFLCFFFFFGSPLSTSSSCSSSALCWPIWKLTFQLYSLFFPSLQSLQFEIRFGIWSTTGERVWRGRSEESMKITFLEIPSIRTRFPSSLHTHNWSRNFPSPSLALAYMSRFWRFLTTRASKKIIIIIM